MLKNTVGIDSLDALPGYFVVVVVLFVVVVVLPGLIADLDKAGVSSPSKTSTK